jgi:hypothetical protein
MERTKGSKKKLSEGLLQRIKLAAYNTRRERKVGSKHADEIADKASHYASFIHPAVGEVVKKTGTLAKHAAQAYVIGQESRRLKKKKLI